MVALAVSATFGLMAAFDAPIRMTTSMLPSFLLVAGVADSVHILAIFYQRLDLTGSREQAIVEAMGHSGPAVLLTTLTTAVGLGSFLTAEIIPIADLGIFGPAGGLGAEAPRLFFWRNLPCNNKFSPPSIWKWIFNQKSCNG